MQHKHSSSEWQYPEGAMDVLFICSYWYMLTHIESLHPSSFAVCLPNQALMETSFIWSLEYLELSDQTASHRATKMAAAH